jgi:hypothetical protein
VRAEGEIGDGGGEGFFILRVDGGEVGEEKHGGNLGRVNNTNGIWGKGQLTTC